MTWLTNHAAPSPELSCPKRILVGLPSYHVNHYGIANNSCRVPISGKASLNVSAFPVSNKFPDFSIFLLPLSPCSDNIRMRQKSLINKYFISKSENRNISISSRVRYVASYNHHFIALECSTAALQANLCVGPTGAFF